MTFSSVLKQPSQGSLDGQAYQRPWVCVDAQVLWSMRLTHSLIQSFRLQPKGARNVRCGKQTNREEQTEGCGAAWKPNRILKTVLPTASAMTYLQNG